MKKGERLKGGFTIIEVVLVLAVAGLIFAMAFIAVPALQRSQRDNTRRDDMTKFVTEVKRYQTSNRGNLPGAGNSSSSVIGVEWDENWKNQKPAANTWDGFYASYLGERFRDPSGNNYKLKIMDCKANRADSPCDSSVNTAINTLQSSSFGSGDYSYTMLVVTRGKCNGTSVVGSSSPRNLAVVYRLEGSGVYCYGT